MSVRHRTFRKFEPLVSWNVLTNRFIDHSLAARSFGLGTMCALGSMHQSRYAWSLWRNTRSRLLGLCWLWCWSVLFRSSTGHDVLGSKTAENDYHFNYKLKPWLTGSVCEAHAEWQKPWLTGHVAILSVCLVPPAKVANQAVGRTSQCLLPRGRR